MLGLKPLCCGNCPVVLSAIEKKYCLGKVAERGGWQTSYKSPGKGEKLSRESSSNHCEHLQAFEFMFTYGSETKTRDDSIFPNIPALDQFNFIEKASFKPAQLDQ